MACAQPHPKFYYHDGNVCLQAGNVIFRLVKSMLAEHSTLFDQLFSEGTEDNCDEMHEGAPLIRVDDAPEDLEALFQLLWQPRLAEPEFDDLWKVLRMSDKYLIDDVRSWCVKELERRLPFSTAGALQTLKCYQSQPARITQVIKDSRLCNVPQFLPLALYALACRPSSITARSPETDHNILIRMYAARDRLRSVWWDFVYGCHDLGWKDSNHPLTTGCPNGKGRVPKKPCNVGAPERAQLSPLTEGENDPLMYFLATKKKTDVMCPPCRDAHRARCNRFAEILINSLPTMFSD